MTDQQFEKVLKIIFWIVVCPQFLAEDIQKITEFPSSLWIILSLFQRRIPRPTRKAHYRCINYLLYTRYSLYLCLLVSLSQHIQISMSVDMRTCLDNSLFSGFYSICQRRIDWTTHTFRLQFSNMRSSSLI